MLACTGILVSVGTRLFSPTINTALSPYQTDATDCDYIVYTCMLVTQRVWKTLSLWKSTVLSNSKEMSGSSAVLSEFLECYLLLYILLILGNLSVFKSVPITVTGSFTATSWIWNVAIYTADPK
jgi:hypothetical protein